MRRSGGPGRSVVFEDGDGLAVWYEEAEGNLHFVSNIPGRGFHVAINRDPAKAHGHPVLFDRLAACLRQVGAPHPEI